MSNTVIKVEHLSKSYVLRHNTAQSYTALRDVLANKAKSVFGKQAAESPSRETFMALNDVSFDVQQGDRIGIIGRNGAGKSTLLKLLSRIITPTTGRITMEGRVASLLEVGTGFHPELTGRENIFLNGSILGMSKKEIARKFDEIVAFSEVERFLDTPVKRYSSGMYVRLAFAVAAHLEPEILIVDEVLAVGDAEFQKKCLGKMKDVSSEGRTILFVSHNMAAVSALCNKAIILQKGSLYDSGTTEQMINSYMQAGKKSSGENRDDSAPSPSQKLKIRSVRVHAEDGMTLSELNNDGKGFVEIEFEIIKEGRGYDVALQLNHAQHGIIFTTCLKDIDTELNDARVWSKGTFTYRVQLPLEYMRGGDYSIIATAGIPKIELLDTFRHETTFSIFDSTSPIAKTTEGREGAIVPVIAWKPV